MGSSLLLSARRINLFDVWHPLVAGGLRKNSGSHSQEKEGQEGEGKGEGSRYIRSKGLISYTCLHLKGVRYPRVHRH